MNTHRREFMKTISAAGLGAACLPWSTGGQSTLHPTRDTVNPTPPNIIFILADDAGRGDFGCYDGPYGIQTPNVDRMATEGMKFEHFYAAAAVCTPTRASFMTGCYPKRVNLLGVLTPKSEDKKGLNPEEPSIARILKGAGYATACVGKWHLGTNPQCLPTSIGFDYYYGMPGPNHGNSDFYVNDQVIEKQGEIDLDQLTQRYTTEALKFIRANQDRPFFLYFAHSAPHWPNFASEHFKGSADGQYGNMVEEMDWSIGEVLKILAELGLDEKTLVIFTSDNGREHKPAPPLRGYKGMTWEGGVREPGVAYWPGKIKPGSVCHEIATTFDMLPTFAALAGASIPTDKRVDGTDISPLLLGAPNAKGHETFLYYNTYNQGTCTAIRMGKWKLHVQPPSRKNKKKHKDLDASALGELPWLINLEEDPGETVNLASQHPEIVQRLKADLEKRDAELSANQRPCFDTGKKRTNK